MDFSDVLYEVIFPALIYLVLGAAGIIGAVISRKAKKELKQTARRKCGTSSRQTDISHSNTGG